MGYPGTVRYLRTLRGTGIRTGRPAGETLSDSLCAATGTPTLVAFRTPRWLSARGMSAAVRGVDRAKRGQNIR